jgi:hypothetical protein
MWWFKRKCKAIGTMKKNSWRLSLETKQKKDSVSYWGFLCAALSSGLNYLVVCLGLLHYLNKKMKTTILWFYSIFFPRRRFYCLCGFKQVL